MFSTNISSTCKEKQTAQRNKRQIHRNSFSQKLSTLKLICNSCNFPLHNIQAHMIQVSGCSVTSHSDTQLSHGSVQQYQTCQAGK